MIIPAAMRHFLPLILLLTASTVCRGADLSPAWKEVRDRVLERSEQLSYPVERDRLLDEVCAAVGAGIIDRTLTGEAALGLLESIPVFKLGYPREDLMQAIERGVLVVHTRREEEAARAAEKTGPRPKP
jgi:hypothetical protein